VECCVNIRNQVSTWVARDVQRDCLASCSMMIQGHEHIHGLRTTRDDSGHEKGLQSQLHLSRGRGVLDESPYMSCRCNVRGIMNKRLLAPWLEGEEED
jgi:hypothetical protein